MRSVKRLVNTPDYPKILVEGELKALAAMNTVGLSMLVVGVGGAWSWSYRGDLLKDFDRVALKDREVYIVFPEQETRRAIGIPASAFTKIDGIVAFGGHALEDSEHLGEENLRAPDHH